MGLWHCVSGLSALAGLLGPTFVRCGWLARRFDFTGERFGAGHVERNCSADGADEFVSVTAPIWIIVKGATVSPRDDMSKS